jgi:ATP-dependent Clp protease ATP-binding subunit ClpB
MTELRMLLDPAKMGSGAVALDEDLRRRIVGQEDAVRQVVGLYQTFLAGMSNPDRPVGSLLFLGPTGSGKTRTVEALAESLAGDPHALLKIDCAEFQHSHEIAKLIGSPPGYLGHKETRALLCQENLDMFHTEKLKLSFVLFDEVEKASDALWNLLLGILDKATLTLGDNRRVDFSRAIIVLTSNLGAAEMEAIVRPRLGFNQPALAADEANRKMGRAGVEAARRRFTPEFLNRLDGIVSFRPLGEPELGRILDLELDQVRQRLAHATAFHAVTFDISAAARGLLLREGTDQRYGARHLKRAIERRLVAPLSNLIASGQLAGGDSLIVDFDSARDALLFFKECEEPGTASAAA